MKNILVLTRMTTFLLLSSLLFSQKKYPSLLWEISGNNLKEKSYLYGTMHVSEKIAFNLSDVFFEKLYSVKQVALESDPGLWLEDMNEEIRTYGSIRNDDNYDVNDLYKYTYLYLKPIETTKYGEVLRIYNFLVNNILYRRYSGMQSFQENTYLDMFIYQAAKKLSKKFHGLEDFKESRELIKKIDFSDYYNEYDNRKPWMKKLLKGQSVHTVMEDAYRKQDLDLIDSLHKGYYSAKSLKYILYLRNDNMVKAMDSLMKKGSLFSAVGAAHLAGEKGVIEKLRAKGYTVKPLSGAYTEKGKKQKETIDKLLYNQSVSTYNTYDEFSIKAPNKFFTIPYEQYDYLISLDIPNGAFLTVSKFNHYNFLNKNSHHFSLQSLDSLLYENIPGKILHKKYISNNKYQGIDVVCKNENEYLNTQIYLTPLEIYIFNLQGTENYKNKYKNTIFSSLKLKSYTRTFSDFTPAYGGYTVNLPEYRINTDMLNHPANITAYDTNSNSYYFISSEVLDIISPEKETYELKRIPYEFGKNLNAENIETTVITSDSIPYSETYIKLTDEKKLYLKTLINGSHYHIIGIVTSDESLKDKYFNSFRLTDFKKFRNPENYKNKTGGYSVNVPFKPRDEAAKRTNAEPVPAWSFRKHPFEAEKKANIKPTLTEKSETIEFSPEGNDDFSVDNTAFYKLDNNQNIYISYKDHSIQYKNYSINKPQRVKDVIDEFIAGRVGSDSCATEKIRFLNTGISAHNYPYSDYILENENSAQAYKLRYFFENDRIYEIKYVINRHQEFKNPPAEEIANTILFIKPEEEKKEAAEKLENTENTDSDISSFKENDLVPAEKTQTKTTDNNNDPHKDHKINPDSLIRKADDEKNQPILNKIKSISSDHKKVEDFILNSTQDSLNSEVLKAVIQVLDFHNKTNPEFYEKLYPKFKNNGNAEFSILSKIISSGNDKKSLKKVIRLLKSAPPIPGSEYYVQDLFYSFQNIEDPEDDLFPELLSFLTIDEYKKPIVSYLLKLNTENKLKARHIKKYKNYFFTEAENVFKRIINSSENKNEVNDPSPNYDKSYELKNYLNILSVIQGSGYDGLISKIRSTKNADLLTILRELKNPVDLTQSEYLSMVKENIPSKELNKAFKEKFGQDIYNPEKDITADLAKKMLLKGIREYDYYSEQKIDSLIFEKEKILNFDTEKYKVFYFTIFKSENEENSHSPHSEEKDKEEEEEGEDKKYNGINIVIMVYDLTPENEKECSYSNSMVKAAFYFPNLSYYSEEDRNELDKNFIDYLENRNHSRATTLFNEYEINMIY
ncbi:MAG: TraB/GumN family protein [Flavobacteriaceae bacterium]|jgi:uncharacterized protein YbaP (TraB family)|nr:TraB/GumN family protein [Flavobacteriaceae bacterium]